MKFKAKISSLSLGKCTKLAPRYCRPFQILAKIGPMAYQLDLPANIHVYNVFHVSLLKKYVHYSKHVIDWNAILVEPKG